MFLWVRLGEEARPASLDDGVLVQPLLSRLDAADGRADEPRRLVPEGVRRQARRTPSLEGV
jgi:hypothetical protein